MSLCNIAHSSYAEVHHGNHLHFNTKHKVKFMHANTCLFCRSLVKNKGRRKLRFILMESWVLLPEFKQKSIWDVSIIKQKLKLMEELENTSNLWVQHLGTLNICCRSTAGGWNVKMWATDDGGQRSRWLPNLSRIPAVRIKKVSSRVHCDLSNVC